MNVLGKALSLEDGVDGHLVFGELDLWLRRRPGEWLIAESREGGQEDRPPGWEETPAPEDVTWGRWVTGDGNHSIVMRTLCPDRPVVVRPEMPVRLSPGQVTDFYVGVPLWVEVATGIKSGAETLCEFPSVQLSSTWFGTPQEGEPCYSLRTHAYRSAEQLADRQHRCICSLQVKNSSSEILSFERICLRCQHLQVYRGTSRFWTNPVRLSYRGRQEWSRVVYGRQPPGQGGAHEVVAAARKPAPKGFNVQSFLGAERIGGIV